MSYRADVAVEILAIIDAHRPDETGRCAGCQAHGDDEQYPCPPVAYAIRAIDLLARRIAGSGATISERGNPVRIDLSRASWRRPSASVGSDGSDRSGVSGTEGCVEVAFLGDNVAVRNSDGPNGPIVFYTMEEWRAFLAGVREGEFG